MSTLSLNSCGPDSLRWADHLPTTSPGCTRSSSMQSSYLRLQPTSGRSRSDTHSNSLANDSPGNKSRLLLGFASSSISLSGASSNSSSYSKNPC